MRGKQLVHETSPTQHPGCSWGPEACRPKQASLSSCREKHRRDAWSYSSHLVPQSDKQWDRATQKRVVGRTWWKHQHHGVNTARSWSATGRELADGPPLCRTQDRGDGGQHLQSSAGLPPCCWAPHAPPEGGWRRESRNAHLALQAHHQTRAGKLRVAPLEQARCPYAGTRKSCGSLLSPGTSRQVGSLLSPGTSRQVNPQGAAVLVSMVVIKGVSHVSRPPNRTDAWAGSS